MCIRDRNNSELADILGNFINRTFTFVFKHFDGKVPTLGKLEKIDEDMLKEISEYPKRAVSYTHLCAVLNLKVDV